jgi:hypothetical protein
VNEDGAWTIFKRCRARGGATVGPGYVARFVTADGRVLVDDERRPGTLNDSRFGGLGAFGWHHARGRPGQLRFSERNAWEISGRSCAADNDGFGVLRSRVLEEPRTEGSSLSLAVEVLYADAFTAPSQPLMRVRYRFRFLPSAVNVWVVATQLCPDGSCGRGTRRAFLKEPKVVAYLGTGAPLPYTRLATFDDLGRLVCISLAGGPAAGPILDTGQCAAPGRTRLRFDRGTATSGAEGDCERGDCFNVVMRAYPVADEDVEPGGAPSAWEGGETGLDAWAVAAAMRPEAYARDTNSGDDVVWDCHGSSPAAEGVRRWETIGRKDADGRFLSLGGLFPGWEGGRGGYDCEPLARTFGPRGESFGLFASYSLGDGWELR